MFQEIGTSSAKEFLARILVSEDGAPVTRLSPGEKVELLLAGRADDQGRYHLNAVYAGRPPTELEIGSRSDRRFGAVTRAVLSLVEPCVACAYTIDLETSREIQTCYLVCASDEQLVEASELTVRAGTLN